MSVLLVLRRMLCANPSVRQAATLLVAVGMLLPTVVMAQAPPLSVRNIDPVVQRGDVVEVQVTIGSDANPVSELNGVGFELTYDPNVLSFQNHQLGALFTPVSSNIQEIGPRDTGSSVEYSVSLFFGASPLSNAAGEVVRFRFTVKSDATLGSAALALRNADRSTGSAFGLPVSLNDDAVSVSTTRRGERVLVSAGSVSDGTNEVQFDAGDLFTLDFASLSEDLDAQVTRIHEPFGGTTLPLSGGNPQHRALNAYWTVSQTGSASFTVDVCFALSDLSMSVPDVQQLRVYKRSATSNAWVEQTAELRPSTNPTHICALDVTSFSEFTVASPQGHNRTLSGTAGTGNDTGWRSLALPASASRITLEDNLDFNVDSGALVQTWDGSQYVEINDPTTTLQRGEGFMVYVFDDAVDEVTGSGRLLDLPASSEDQSVSVTVTGLGLDDRFHFLGNPYNVVYSLGGLANGDLSAEGFQQTVQVWNPNPPGPGQFEQVTQGTANDDIAAWQSFFVERASLGSGTTTLTFDPGGKGSGPGTLQGSKQESAPLAQVPIRLHLQVTSASRTIGRDGLTLLVDDRAAPTWDGLEASQLAPPNASSYVTLNSPIMRNEALTRRALASEPFPAGDAPITVPLSAQSIGIAGTATLRWPASERNAVPDDWEVELVDTQTGTTVDLRSNSYAFDLRSGDGSPSDATDARFRLRVTPSTAIPVELASFRGTRDGDAVQLTWETASETNNAGFSVERRAAANAAWTDIGFVEGNGTTSKPQRYRFKDDEVPYAADSLSYRLRQVDTDGTVHHSAAVAVARGTPAEAHLNPPFPNPARQQVHLQYAVPEPTDVRIAVYDVLGRKVATWTRGDVNAGRYERSASLRGLAAGTYFVRLVAGTTVHTRRLTVVR